jgi:hypothetical protein
MEILFAGICLWEGSKKPALLGLMPNGKGGMNHGGHTIPPHTAGIMVKSGEVDASQWPKPPANITVKGVPHLLFELDGEDLSFDPVPNGGTTALPGLPALGCVGQRVIKPSLTGNAPARSAVLARIQMPGNARMNVVNNRHGAKVARVDVADGTELVSKPFDGSPERRLKFTGPTAIVANIDLASALALNPNPDDEHAHLYCPMFITEGEAETVAEASTASVAEPDAKAVLARLRGRLADQLTIGPGCSNTQWP